MKTPLFFFSCLLILLSACNKNQRKVLKLDGKWNVISAERQGYGESNPHIIYEFEYCKLKHNDFCDFAIHNFETNEVTNGLFQVIEDGTKAALTISSGFGYQYREYDIIKLSNRKLILVNYNVPHGELSRLELRHVK